MPTIYDPSPLDPPEIFLATGKDLPRSEWTLFSSSGGGQAGAPATTDDKWYYQVTHSNRAPHNISIDQSTFSVTGQFDSIENWISGGGYTKINGVTHPTEWIGELTRLVITFDEEGNYIASFPEQPLIVDSECLVTPQDFMDVVTYNPDTDEEHHWYGVPVKYGAHASIPYPVLYSDANKSTLTTIDTTSPGSLLSSTTFTPEIGDILFPDGDYEVDPSGITEAFVGPSPKYSELKYNVLRIGSVIAEQKSVKEEVGLLTQQDEELRRSRQIIKEEVYVICRSDNTASCEIADAYVTKRQLPSGNKIEVDMTSLGITWPSNQWHCSAIDAIDVMKHIKEKLDQAENTSGKEVRAIVFAGNWPYYASRPDTEPWFPHSLRTTLGVSAKGYGIDFFNAFSDRDGYTKARNFVDTNQTISSYVSSMTEEQKDLLAWYRVSGRRERKLQNGFLQPTFAARKYEYPNVNHATRLLTPKPQVASFRLTAVSTLPAGRDDAFKTIAIQRVQDCIDVESANEEDFGIILNSPSTTIHTTGIDHVAGYRIMGLPEEKLFFEDLTYTYSLYSGYSKYPDTGYEEKLNGQPFGVLQKVGHPDYTKVTGGEVGLRAFGGKNYYGEAFYVEEDGDVDWKKGAIICTSQSFGARPPPQCGHDEDWVISGVVPKTVTWNCAPDGVGTIEVDNGGSGYVDASPPAVTLEAPTSGTPATATAGVSGGVVTGITITEHGSGYDDDPDVSIAAPTSGTQATATADLQTNRVDVDCSSTDAGSGTTKRLFRLYAKNNNISAPIVTQITDYAAGGEIIITENGTETERYVWKDKTINQFYADYNEFDNGATSNWKWNDAPGEGHIPSKVYQAFKNGAAIGLHAATQEPNANPSYWNLIPILYDGGSIADYLVAHELTPHDTFYNTNHLVEYGDPLFAPFRHRTDKDLDGTPDWADLDDDNDGTPDVLDAFPLDPTESSDADNDGIGDNADLDDDNDGFPDSVDQMPKNPAEQHDSDGDGVGDNVDTDDDNDGVSDRLDVSPRDSGLTSEVEYTLDAPMQELSQFSPAELDFLRPNGFRFQIANIPQVSFFCQAANIPQVSLGSVEMQTPLTTLSFPGEKLQFGELMIRFLVQEDMGNYNELYAWMVGLGFPDSNQQFSDYIESQSFRTINAQKDKKESIAQVSDAVLFVLDSNNNPSVKITFMDVFPTSLEGLDFDITQGNADYFTASAGFRYRTFKIDRLN